MQIELIGPSSAGKSTLARGILQAGREQGIDTLMGGGLVLKQFRLNWIKGRTPRVLCVDLMSLLACLATLRRNFDFYQFTIQTILRLTVAGSWLEKLNIARNVLRKIGIYEIVRHYGSDQQIVVVDEGSLHTAHHLFVHLSVEPSTSDLSTYISMVPLPDLVIYVQQDEGILIERTLTRGHKRIPNGSYAEVESFINLASDTFDKLIRQLEINGRISALDNEQDPFTSHDYQDDPTLSMALHVISSGRDLILADQPSWIVPDSKLLEVYTSSTTLCEN
jgi:thymidylate kinase